MLQTETWARNSFNAECVQITEENIQSVANWCGGEIGFTSRSKPYVRFEAIPRVVKTKVNAHIGDWVIFVDGVFKHYRHLPFLRAFSKPKDIRGEIQKLMENALSVNLEICQSSWEDLAKDYTDQAMKIIEGEQ